MNNATMDFHLWRYLIIQDLHWEICNHENELGNVTFVHVAVLHLKKYKRRKHLISLVHWLYVFGRASNVVPQKDKAGSNGKLSNKIYLDSLCKNIRFEILYLDICYQIYDKNRYRWGWSSGWLQKRVSESRHIRKQGRASLVAQWLRICLPMQGTRVRALVREDPTCHRATKPMSHNYWACALEPMSHSYWSPCT